MNFRVTQDMYHMTVVIFSTLANGSLKLLCADIQRNKQTNNTTGLLFLPRSLRHRQHDFTVILTVDTCPESDTISLYFTTFTTENTGRLQRSIQNTERINRRYRDNMYVRASPHISSIFCIRMPSYRPAVALCARGFVSVWLFHLPAVTVDLGHYLESGVRRSED